MVDAVLQRPKQMYEEQGVDYADIAVTQPAHVLAPPTHLVNRQSKAMHWLWTQASPTPMGCRAGRPTLGCVTMAAILD